MLSAMLVSILTVGVSQGPTMASPTAFDIRRSVADVGAEATVRSLSKDGHWNAVEAEIGTGDADWVALAPLLAPGTDAGTSEGLSISLADALPKNPRAVLAVLNVRGGDMLGAEHVCAAPFIEDTAEHQASYKKSALRSLSGITEASLQPARVACIDRLSRAR